jgi:hypothetical protein
MRSIMGGTPMLVPLEQHPGTLDDVDPPPVPEVPTQPGAVEQPDTRTLISPPPPAPVQPPPRAVTAQSPIVPPKRSRRAWIAAVVGIAVAGALFLALGSEPEAVKQEPSREQAAEIAEEPPPPPLARPSAPPIPPPNAPPVVSPPAVESAPPTVVRAEPVVLPSRAIEPARTADRARKPKPKKGQAPKKPGKKVSKPVPSDGIIEEW